MALEPFIEVNHNSYLHSSTAFGGVPQRYREVMSDFNGYTAELLAKAVNQHKLDEPVSEEERHHLLAAMQAWGLLDGKYAYTKENWPRCGARLCQAGQGGGPHGAPVPSAAVRAERDHALGPVAVVCRSICSTTSRPRCSSRWVAWT